ncbi:MAG: hypothetical protein FJX56_13290, partial [Alphaproteobacteria bacterium]|nr:hypothetical protein [Alphaproteobacteria bacterium]
MEGGEDGSEGARDREEQAAPAGEVERLAQSLRAAEPVALGPYNLVEKRRAARAGIDPGRAPGQLLGCETDRGISGGKRGAVDHAQRSDTFCGAEAGIGTGLRQIRPGHEQRRLGTVDGEVRQRDISGGSGGRRGGGGLGHARQLRSAIADQRRHQRRKRRIAVAQLIDQRERQASLIGIAGQCLAHRPGAQPIAIAQAARRYDGARLGAVAGEPQSVDLIAAKIGLDCRLGRARDERGGSRQLPSRAQSLDPHAEKVDLPRLAGRQQGLAEQQPAGKVVHRRRGGADWQSGQQALDEVARGPRPHVEAEAALLRTENADCRRVERIERGNLDALTRGARGGGVRRRGAAGRL